jgi:hypothetical protein
VGVDVGLELEVEVGLAVVDTLKPGVADVTGTLISFFNQTNH